MVLTQTDVNNLNSQYKNLKVSSKSIFVAAVLAAKAPADLDFAVIRLNTDFENFAELEEFINREQELIDASNDGTDSDDDLTTDVETNTPADNEPIEGPGTTSPTKDPTPAESTAATGTAPAQTVATDPASTTPPGSNTTPPAA